MLNGFVSPLNLVHNSIPLIFFTFKIALMKVVMVVEILLKIAFGTVEKFFKCYSLLLFFSKRYRHNLKQ